MGSPGQLKQSVCNTRSQLGMRTIRSRHHHSDISHLEQGKIVGRISERQHVHVRDPLTLLQRVQSPPFADPLAQQMRHAIALNNGESPLMGQRQQPLASRWRRRHEWNTATPTLSLSQHLSSQTQQTLTVSIAELVEGMQRFTELRLQQPQLRSQFLISRS